MKHQFAVGLASAATAISLVCTAGCTADPEPPGKGTASEVPEAPAVERTAHPNILLITVDDASATDVADMPHVQELIGDRGVTLTGAIAPTPICVPARASLLTGQYTHNHGALAIGGAEGGAESFSREDRDDDTLPVWLNAAGYETFFVGKYLNGYGHDEKTSGYVPPGWTGWHASLDPETYNYDHTQLSENGTVDDPQEVYSADGFADRADDLLADPRRTTRPWFMTVNYVAPHYGGPWEDDDPKAVESRRGNSTAQTNPRFPPTPKVKDEDRDTFADRALPTGPEMFYEAPDQYAGASRKFRPTPKRRAYMRELHQQRLESLQAVDRAVAGHLRTLRRTKQLRDTVVVFTSDNGYSIGQRNLDGKLWFYESELKVPMLVRGPGIEAGSEVDQVVTHVDLPVTLAAMAGATPSRTVDGIDVSALLEGTGRSRDRIVPIEAYPVETDSTERLYSGIRVAGRWTYARLKTGQEELYDLAADPHQLRNLAERRPEVLATMRELDEKYRDCVGASCPQPGDDGDLP